ncbi:MFS transporter [Brenneria goodwinii]|uniref:Probable glucarate transporter n=1 Tax=Brenneria goodwinii TaxID=1109412 RepID=A0A0G4JW43_9GAMM|nr:MFS transporter [Brenneria goodwinii]CPR17311.1 Probable glucarate transporter [Brenneria goodwinii]
MSQYIETTKKEKPTAVRWFVFFLMLVLGAINYIDRTSLGIAMPFIQEEFGIKDQRVVGLLHSAFFWSYALMQIPSGFLADKFKTRTIITCATVVWGAFQALGAACHTIFLLMLTRIGLGISEAPIMPAGAKLMGSWLTPNERGRGSMLLDGGAPLGTAFGAILLTWLIGHFGSWRAAFVVAGVGTVLVGVVAWFYIRNKPSEHPGVNQAELQHIEKGIEQAGGIVNKKSRLRNIVPYLTQVNVIALICGWVCYSIVFYGLMVWVPAYLNQEHGFNVKEMGSAMFMMFIMCFVGQQLGGWLADKWRQAGGSPNKVFHTLLAISAIVSGVGVFLCANTKDPLLAVIFLTIALFPLRWASVYWSIPGLLGAQHMAGTITGTMNFSSNMIAAIVPILVGFMIQSTGSYYAAMMFFAVAAIGYLVSSLLINFNRKLVVKETK